MSACGGAVSRRRRLDQPQRDDRLAFRVRPRTGMKESVCVCGEMLLLLLQSGLPCVRPERERALPPHATLLMATCNQMEIPTHSAAAALLPDPGETPSGHQVLLHPLVRAALALTCASLRGD